MKWGSLAFVLCLAGFALPATAQEVDCATAMNQADMNDCAAADWERADVVLNQRYKEAMALLRDWDADLPEALKGGPETLREAQRAWITYRDAACAVAGYPMRGGSAEPLLVYGCKRQLTEQRTSELESLLDYENP